MTDVLKTYPETQDELNRRYDPMTRDNLITECERLRAIETVALRVASSRREGIVMDKGALDLLDQALERE